MNSTKTWKRRNKKIYVVLEWLEVKVSKQDPKLTFPQKKKKKP